MKEKEKKNMKGNIILRHYFETPFNREREYKLWGILRNIGKFATVGYDRRADFVTSVSN